MTIPSHWIVSVWRYFFVTIQKGLINAKFREDIYLFAQGRILAVDGSVLQISTKPNDAETFYPNVIKSRHWSLTPAFVGSNPTTPAILGEWTQKVWGPPAKRIVSVMISDSSSALSAIRVSARSWRSQRSVKPWQEKHRWFNSNLTHQKRDALRRASLLLTRMKCYNGREDTKELDKPYLIV